MSNRRRPRPLKREVTSMRDARIFVVATEDTYAPRQYFDQLRLSRIQVEVLATEDGKSAALDVLARLRSYREQFQLDEDDVLWIMLDTDRFAEKNGLRKYMAALSEAKSMNIRILINKPCFDFWLFLHVADVAELAEGFECKQVGKFLVNKLGSFNKKRIDTNNFSLVRLPLAFARAKALDKQELLPKSSAAQVYQLLQEILLHEPLSHMPDELKELATEMKRSGGV